MERNQELTIAYITVKVNGGVNVLRNIFHFNSEAIEDAFRNEFNDMARLTDFVAVSGAQIGASISYGDNLPNTEYNRKLEVIKTLSAKDIEFVNEKVAGKLEKVYTILKELASDKPAESNEPLIDYEIGRSKDVVFEKIEQTAPKVETVDRNEIISGSVDKFISPFSRPEVQQAIAEMKQKPSLFQRIKDWFTN